MACAIGQGCVAVYHWELALNFKLMKNKNVLKKNIREFLCSGVSKVDCWLPVFS